MSVSAGAGTNPRGEICPQGTQVIPLSQELFRVDRTPRSSGGQIPVEPDFEIQLTSGLLVMTVSGAAAEQIRRPASAPRLRRLPCAGKNAFSPAETARLLSREAGTWGSPSE